MRQGWTRCRKALVTLRFEVHLLSLCRCPGWTRCRKALVTLASAANSASWRRSGMDSLPKGIGDRASAQSTGTDA